MRVSPRLIAALAAVVVGAGLVAVLSRDEESYPDEWDSRLAELVDFVADARGHAFEHPVPVDFLDEQAYAERTRTDAAGLTDEEVEDIDDSEALLRALGLVEGDVDLLESTNDLSDTGTLAFYDFEEKRIVIRGTEVTPDLAVTLVHELTHVLQDQLFDLGRLQDDDVTSGEQFAFQALAEGDADRIESEYLESLDADERAVIDASDEAGLENLEEEGIPPALQAFFGAPYAVGDGFVRLLADRGDDEVDDAFEEPPTTEEQLLDPFAFFDHDGPTTVDQPEVADADDVFDEGDFGALSLLLVLAERIDFPVALDAALGWGGDSYVAFHRDGHTCVALRVVGDETSDTDELEVALGAWAAADTAGTATAVRDGDVVRLESCDPGTDAAAGGSGGSYDALQRIAIRTEILAQWIDAGADDVSAECFADAVLGEFTLDELTSEDEPPDFQSRLETVASGCA